ncbi:hypothetical protein ACGYKB_16010 [Sulfitobacter sp. 916]|uniref:hypothetical protein n=1 Tax=Sulfitobacter sp. 916 TaxID=3368559 RepID=UPI003744D5ED
MTQAIALAVVQETIAARHPSKSIELSAQVHHIRHDDVAFIDVYGCDNAEERRSIRAEAVMLLRDLGIHVELIGNHDVFTVSPDFSDPAALRDCRSRLAERYGATKRRQIRNDIELAILGDPTSAGHVYVDFEGINPRILAPTEDKAKFVAYADRILTIFRALHGEFRADPALSMRGMTFSINTTVVSNEQRAAARRALTVRLAEAGYSKEQVEQLIPPSQVGVETISEYAMRILGDDPPPPPRIPKPRRRSQPPRSRPPNDVT